MNPLPENPRVTIVTPSFNQADYLRQTLESVANQTYPRVEHLVLDGGSNDGSADILRDFATTRDPECFRWVSEPDGGQADAINKGLEKAGGHILAYLNSDDLYEPDAVEKAVTFFLQNPEAAFVHGRGQHIDPEGNPLDPYPSKPCDFEELAVYNFICQPTAFWRAEVYRELGGFKKELRYCMDYEYWIRVSRRFQMGFLASTLAYTRLHDEAKTVGQREPMHREIVRMQYGYYGKVSPHWIYSLANAHPGLSALREGNVLQRAVAFVWFLFRSAGLFLKWNRRIPLREFQRFFHRVLKQDHEQIIR